MSTPKPSATRQAPRGGQENSGAALRFLESLDPQAIVLDFIGQFRDHWPADFDIALAPLAEDASYQIAVPTVTPIRGRAAIKAELLRMQGAVEDQKHEMKCVAFDGRRTVFTERVDYSLRHGKWTPVPLVAVFEVNEQGQISSWREFLDLARVSREHGMSIDQLLGSLEPH